ncbi:MULTISPECIES: hypothetical protein [Mesorhizobium]|uniref:hypothetical protein n=1 Tax=Mesorhizobium TaxID=68287 RepID=UPI0012EC8CFE|nr:MULTISPECIES: hypothetical protein [unclassified Mesorhizobium]
MLDFAGKLWIIAGCARHLPSLVDENTESRSTGRVSTRLANSWMAKTLRRAKMKRSSTPIHRHSFFLVSNKGFSLRVELLPKRRWLRYAVSGPGKRI